MSLNEIINSKSNEHVLFAGSIINTLNSKEKWKTSSELKWILNSPWILKSIVRSQLRMGISTWFRIGTFRSHWFGSRHTETPMSKTYFLDTSNWVALNLMNITFATFTETSSPEKIIHHSFKFNQFF